MTYLGDYSEDFSTLDFKFTTKNTSDVPTTLAGSPVISVYKVNDLTQSIAGVTLTVDFDGVVGLNNVLIDLSADVFYESATDYHIIITTGTVNSVDYAGTVVGLFSISRASAAVWDEVLTGATHNIPTSSGKILRLLQEGGFSTSSIWIDTSAAPGGDGTVTDPADNMTAALVIAVATGFRRFEYVTGSSDTFGASVEEYCISGFGYTIDLNGQSISGTRINNASISGVCTGALPPEFRDCEFGDSTLPPCSLRSVSFGGDITLSAGNYYFDQCFSSVAGISTPTFDFSANGSTNLNIRHYSGGVRVDNMGVAGTDRMSLEGDGQLILNASCMGGTIAIRGHFTITDNADGSVILSDLARYDVEQEVGGISR